MASSQECEVFFSFFLSVQLFVGSVKVLNEIRFG